MGSPSSLLLIQLSAQPGFSSQPFAHFPPEPLHLPPHSSRTSISLRPFSR